MTRLVLATTSPHRIAACRQWGIEFITAASDVDEYTDDRPKQPEMLVRYLARLKAESVASRPEFKDDVVVGCDSVGYAGTILEKPKSEAEALERIMCMSGKTHKFHTGIHLIRNDTKQCISNHTVTAVLMRRYTEEEAVAFLRQTNRYKTCALGYDPAANHSMTFVKEIMGSYTNLLYGLPLETMVEMLGQAGLPATSLIQRNCAGA